MAVPAVRAVDAHRQRSWSTTSKPAKKWPGVRDGTWMTPYSVPVLPIGAGQAMGVKRDGIMGEGIY